MERAENLRSEREAVDICDSYSPFLFIGHLKIPYGQTLASRPLLAYELQLQCGVRRFEGRGDVCWN